MAEVGRPASSGIEPPTASPPAPSHPAAEEPRTRGFLFCDLRGYTGFVETNGDRAAAELLSAFRALVRDAILSTGGGEVRTEGDSFYTVFPSASSAVRCGLAIVEGAGQASANRPDRPIRVGVGIHAGEAIEEAEGYVGSAVNIAARVCAVAQPGEVLVSDTVRSLVRTGLPVTFRSRGRPRLKGIGEPIELFAVSAAQRPAPSATSGRRPSRRRIAIVGAGFVLVVALAGSIAIAALGPGGIGSTPGASNGLRGSGTAGAAAVDLSALPGRILFRSIQEPSESGGSTAQVYASRPDGTSRRQLTPLGTTVVQFEPAPDRAQIVYLTSDGELSIASIEGSGSPQRWPGPWGLPDFYEGGPLRPTELYGWLPSGELLLESGRDVAVRPKVRLAANGMAALPVESAGCAGVTLEAGDDLAATLDGSVVAFGNDQDLWVAPPEGCAIRLTNDIEASGPAWAPDGSRIAFRGQTPGGAPDIWVVNGNGSGLRRLTDDPEADAEPAWSPDGAWIVWDRGSGDAARLWVMRADGSDRLQLPIGDVGERLDEPLWVPAPDTTAVPSPTPTVPNPFSIIASYSADQLDLDQPIAMALGPDGNVYITDAHPSVTVVDAFGARVARWARRGTGDGEFDFGSADHYHASIAIGADGRVYISDSQNARVQVLGPTGRYQRQFGTRGTAEGQFEWPFDLSVDSTGNVYVLDDALRSLQKFTPTGAFVWRADQSILPDMTGHGHNADIDAQGRIVIGNDDTGRVLYLDSAGREVDAFDGHACGVTVDAIGNTYIAGCGSDTIEVFDPSHRLIGRWSGPTMPFADPPEFGPNGEVFALGKDGSLIKLSIKLPGS